MGTALGFKYFCPAKIAPAPAAKINKTKAPTGKTFLNPPGTLTFGGENFFPESGLIIKASDFEKSEGREGLEGKEGSGDKGGFSTEGIGVVMGEVGDEEDKG